MNRLWQPRDASLQAVNRCNEAVFRARQVFDAGDDVGRLQAIGVVYAGNDDAAGLAAQDASARCAAASLAARDASARCAHAAASREAQANYHEESLQENYRKEATSAAEQALAAAARCDAAAATAASRAAIAFADSCVMACGDAEVKTLAAREAAARCVLARDDAATAELVVRKSARSRFLETTAWVAHCNACRQSAESHKEARKDAITAALAARKAAVRCAGASRRVVLAASVARKTASLCEAAAEAGSVATRANIAEPADAAAHPDPVVARADVAALEAREAAASCDAALVDPAEEAEEFRDKMRGWLMTVATLFVGIAFQAILHPPDGMSFDRCNILHNNGGKAASGAPSPAPTPSSSAATVVSVTSPDGWPGACLYLFFNMITLATELIMLVVLMTMEKATSKPTIHHIKLMLATLVITVAGSVITGTSRNQGVQLTTLFIFLIYAFISSVGPIDIRIKRRMYSDD